MGYKDPDKGAAAERRRALNRKQRENEKAAYYEDLFESLTPEQREEWRENNSIEELHTTLEESNE